MLFAFLLAAIASCGGAASCAELGDDRSCGDSVSETMMLQMQLDLSQESENRVPMTGQRSALYQNSLPVMQNRSEYPDTTLFFENRDTAANLELPSVERFSTLPKVHNSCAGATGGADCPGKIAFLFEITSEIYHEDVWKSFFADAPREKYSIYIELKNQSADMPLQSYGAIAAEPVETNYCALFGGMMALMHAAYADAGNAHFVFASSDAIPLKSFDHVYRKTAEEAPGRSKFCMNGAFDNDLDNDGCGFLDHIHKHVPLIRKAHQWSVLTREHVALVLTNALQVFPLVREAMVQFSPTDGCSDEYMVLSTLRYALGAEEEEWPEPTMGEKWNITNQCTTIAIWPGGSHCTSPAIPSDIGLPKTWQSSWTPFTSEGPFCFVDIEGTIKGCIPVRFDPFTWKEIHAEHLRNMVCSDFLFARKMSKDVALTGLPQLWNLHADGLAC